MRKLKEYMEGSIFCLFELIAGVMLLIDPIGLTSWIIIIAGGAMMLMGVLKIVKYFRTSAREAAQGQTLVRGLLLMLGGGFCVFRTEWFLVTFPVLTIIYGVAILMTGIAKIQLTVDMLRQKNKKWFLAAINAIVSIICAVVILRSPFSSTVMLWVFTGVALIVEGIFDVITMIMGKRPVED